MINKSVMKKNVKLLILMLSMLIFSACALNGYRISLSTKGSKNVILSIHDALIEKGFQPYDNLEKIYRGNGGVGLRYVKDLGSINRSLFSRKTDYLVNLYLFYTGCTDKNGFDCEIYVYIYNSYKGNDPKMKPILFKEADSIENLLKKSAPNIEVNRFE